MVWHSSNPQFDFSFFIISTRISPNLKYIAYTYKQPTEKEDKYIVRLCVTPSEFEPCVREIQKLHQQSQDDQAQLILTMLAVDNNGFVLTGSKSGLIGQGGILCSDLKTVPLGSASASLVGALSVNPALNDLPVAASITSGYRHLDFTPSGWLVGTDANVFLGDETRAVIMRCHEDIEQLGATIAQNDWIISWGRSKNTNESFVTMANKREPGKKKTVRLTDLNIQSLKTCGTHICILASLLEKPLFHESDTQLLTSDNDAQTVLIQLEEIGRLQSLVHISYDWTHHCVRNHEKEMGHKKEMDMVFATCLRNRSTSELFCVQTDLHWYHLFLDRTRENSDRVFCLQVRRDGSLRNIMVTHFLQFENMSIVDDVLLVNDLVVCHMLDVCYAVYRDRALWNNARGIMTDENMWMFPMLRLLSQ